MLAAACTSTWGCSFLPQFHVSFRVKADQSKDFDGGIKSHTCSVHKNTGCWKHSSASKSLRRNSACESVALSRGRRQDAKKEQLSQAASRKEGSDGIFSVDAAFEWGHEEPPTVLFAAGGTGGHVYPAIAIASALCKLIPTVDIHFAGTKERMEAQAVPAAGFQMHAIPAISVRRPLWSPANLVLPFRLLAALWHSYMLVNRINPDVVVGTGGYVSLPTCLAAALQRRAVVIQEQNAYAGLANRFLGVFATAIFLAFEAAKKYFPKDRCIVGGNPTRASLHTVGHSKAEAVRWFFPDMALSEAEKAQVVLVLGGSLGAAALNGAFEKGGADVILASAYPRRIIWQCGSRYHEKLSRSMGRRDNLLLTPFLDRMDLAYRAADLVIGRAGAITCSELLVTGTPSILIPSPNVAEDHQTKNARTMEQSGAALLMSEKELTAAALGEAVNRLLSDRKGLEDMRRYALAAAKPDAASEIADVVASIAAKRKHRTRGRI